jgi:ABC-type branched-subunit amino acid transport system substrate-binding protein
VDFATLLTSIKGQNPDAIFFGGYDQQAGPMARQMKTLGMDMKLMGGETMNSANRSSSSPAGRRRRYCSDPGALSTPDRAARRSRTSTRPVTRRTWVYGPYFYDGVMLIARRR